MATRLAHRGPDDAGVWVDEASAIVLAHRRLAIIDLSDAGHQPMLSSDGRYVITYNGELYNFKELRAEVEKKDPAHRWKSTCDTEVILEAIRLWGIAVALQRFSGMFALALWDRLDRTLVLARDRLGEKPLYYGNLGGSFLFASELKAFGALPNWAPDVSPEGLELFFRFGSIPGPTSVLKGVFKLFPGTFLRISPDTVAKAGNLPSPTPYWSLYETGQPFPWTRERADQRRIRRRT